MTVQSSSHLRVSTQRRILSAIALCTTALWSLTARSQTKFMEPTHDELSMTSLPGYPGVAAVVLNREETTYDDRHSDTHYERIKILTEEGKKYANVELPYLTTLTTTADVNNHVVGNERSLDDVQGRTIHPDGTIVRFTGKPYIKVMEKGEGYKYQAKIFTLPDVTVGSIIEYCYTTYARGFRAPVWIVQGDLYVKSAQYLWYPRTDNLLDEHGDPIRNITPFPILPKDAVLTYHKLPGTGGKNGLATDSYELTIKDVPPMIDEEYMPPVTDYSYRVYFSYISTQANDDFWKSEGKYWSKKVNSFVNPNSELKDATQKIIASAATQDQKLRAIYAAVQQFENTDYTREHEAREDKAAGLGSEINNASDVFRRKRGNSMQITELFIAMARAAGMQADAMLLPDRSKELFIPHWLEMDQFDDMIAIVNMDGKDQYFDPGERFCPYGHVAWQHQFITGLRQKGNETVFEDIEDVTYKDNTVMRVANLDMDPSGSITGKIDMTYVGAFALRWRHAALRGDDEGLKRELRNSLEELLPHSLEIKDLTISNITDYEKPLGVSYTVQGTLGSWTGKRLALPADLFLVNHNATFPHEKREVAVDFQYPQQIRDALRINFPANFSVEAAPPAAKYAFKTLGAYRMTIDSDATSSTTRRDYAFNVIYVLPEGYPQLRAFYSQLETNDQQSIVLKSTIAPTTAASSTPTAN